MEKPQPLRSMEDESAAFPEIKEQFDAYTRGELHPSKLATNLSAISREHPEVTWDALSLLDQYHRRGLLSAEVFINTKTALHAIAFGTQNAPTANKRAVGSAAESIKKESNSRDPKSELREEYAPPGSPRSSSNKTAAFDSTATIAAAEDVATTRPLTAATELARRYVLLAPLHSTPATTVFKAYDRKRAELPESERFVGIKALNAALLANADARALLQREYLAGKDLSHPNILGTYDFYSDDKACFIVRELLNGQLLSRIVERLGPRRILKTQALAIIREVGLALAYAHEKNIFHGALSMETIGIADLGAVRVFGFGFASLTDAGAIRAYPLDARDDVFSLGCVAYELLAGYAPYIYVGDKLERRWTRLQSVSRRQWRALESALDLQRGRRPLEVRGWLANFIQDDATAMLPSIENIATETVQRHTGLATAGKIIASIAVLAIAALFALPLLNDKLQFPVGKIESVNKAIVKTPLESIDTQNAATSSDTKTDSAPPPVSLAVAAQSPPVAASGSVATTTRVTPPSIAHKSPITEATAAATGISAPGISKIGFTSDQFTVDSSESVARLNLTRSGSLGRESILKWRTVSGSAKPDADYAPSAEGVLHIAAGERSAAILVPIVHGGGQHVSSKWFEVELLDAGNAELSAIAKATVLIVSAD